MKSFYASNSKYAQPNPIKLKSYPHSPKPQISVPKHNSTPKPLNPQLPLLPTLCLLQILIQLINLLCLSQIPCQNNLLASPALVPYIHKSFYKQRKKTQAAAPADYEENYAQVPLEEGQ